MKKEEAIPTDDIFDSLNDAQKDAVLHSMTPLLIFAGPGTGKTLTLTRRIAFLIRKRNIPESQILAVTFTEKAADEMRQRLKRLLCEDMNLPHISTFHSFCRSLLKEEVGKTEYSLIEDGYRCHLIDYAIKKVVQTGIEVALSRDEILKKIAAAKQNMQGTRACFAIDTSEGRAITKIYEIYNEALEIQHLYDFEDLIYKTVVRLEKDEIYRKSCQQRFQYLFIDDYQNISYAQYRLIKILSSSGNICVFGDPNQSISGVRGSDPGYFLEFLKDFPNNRVIRLSMNYRSIKPILDAAFQMMENHQILVPGTAESRDRPTAPLSRQAKIQVAEVHNARMEADAVAAIIEQFCGGSGYRDTGHLGQTGPIETFGYSDIAVLYRTSEQYRLIAESLSRYGIPFQVAGQHVKGDPNETRQILSLCKLMEGYGHYGDFEIAATIWQPSLGKETVHRFCHWGLSNGFNLKEAMYQAGRFPIPEISRSKQEKLIEYIKALKGVSAETSGDSFEKKLLFLASSPRLEKRKNENPAFEETLDSLQKEARRESLSLNEFLSKRELETEIDTVSFDIQKVSLMTLHAAKGLEFPVVFIVGCEDGFIPFHHKTGDHNDMDEERRLFFVAMTRAKEHLFLTWSHTRQVSGKEIERRISPFMGAISPELVSRWEPVFGKQNRPVQTQMKLF